LGVGIEIAVNVALGAGDIEEKMCLAEIEFDFVACAEKLPHGCHSTAEDTPYLSTHRALSKIFRESYAQPTEIDRPRGCDRSGIEREGGRATRDHPLMYHCHVLEHEEAGLMGQYICI